MPMKWQSFTRVWICVKIINVGVIGFPLSRILGNKKTNVISLKLFISAAMLAYIIYLTWGLFAGYLGANPVEVVTHETGEWGLYFLLLSLVITPIRRHFHLNIVLKFRRFLGLWSFSLLFLHLFVFVLFDHFFDVQSIVEDIIERPYIAVGFVAFIIMAPLAITSLKSLQRKMGKHWISLHRCVYVVAILGMIHYWWLVKADVFWPLIFAFILGILLSDRLYWACRKKHEG